MLPAGGLVSGPVQLRDFRSDDLTAVHAIAGDDQVTQWLSFESRDLEGCRSMLAAAVSSATVTPRTEYYLAITAVHDSARPSLVGPDQVVGFVRLACGSHQAAKLGYAVHADQWGRGLASHAVSALCRFGFDHLRVHRITAAVGPDNVRSISVLNRTGFTQEGRLRDHVYVRGSWRDSLLYSLLAGELRPPASG